MYPTKKLSEIAKTTSGGTPSRDKKEYWGGNIPWLKSGELGDNLNIGIAEELITEEGYNNSSAKLFKKGTLLIAMYGATAGKLGMLGIDATTNQAVCSIQNIHNLFIEKYIYFFLLSIREKIVRDSFGGAQPNISKSYLDNLEIPLPLLSVQSLIVAQLDSAFANIDEQISLLGANITDVENMRKSVLDSVFDYPESATIQKLVQKTETWNPINIGNETFEYIDISSIDNSRFVLTETKTIIGKDAPSRAKKLVKENDIIFATTRPNLKNIAIVDRNLKNLTCSTGFCVLRTKSELLNFQYLFYYLISDVVSNKISPMIRGAGYPAISDKDLLSIDIPLPSLSRQHEIVARLDRVFAETTALLGEYEAQIRDLEILKQSLLEEAFAGRLVRENEV